MRVNATSAGGLTEVVKVCALAAAHDLPVSSHVYPENSHSHLAAGLPKVTSVETTDPAQGIEGRHALRTAVDSLILPRGPRSRPRRGCGCRWPADHFLEGARTVPRQGWYRLQPHACYD